MRREKGRLWMKEKVSIDTNPNTCIEATFIYNEQHTGDGT